MKITREQFDQFLLKELACSGAREWVDDQGDLASPQELYEACRVPDWIAWLAGKAGWSLCELDHRPYSDREFCNSFRALRPDGLANTTVDDLRKARPWSALEDRLLPILLSALGLPPPGTEST